jgi:hypothetical protein
MQPDTQPRRDYFLALPVAPWQRGCVPLMGGRSAAFLDQKVLSKRYASYTLGAREDDMSSLSVDEGKLKDLLKTAILELLEERKDLVRELLEEALEDIGLVRAIEAGEHTGTVSRDEVFKVLEGGQ